MKIIQKEIVNQEKVIALYLQDHQDLEVLRVIKVIRVMMVMMEKWVFLEIKDLLV